MDRCEYDHHRMNGIYLPQIQRLALSKKIPMSVAKKWMLESQDKESRSDSNSYTGDCSSDSNLEGITAMKKQRELDSLVEDSDIEMDDSISVSSRAGAVPSLSLQYTVNLVYYADLHSV